MITDDTHIGILNPFRYRSYYFDEEIELYYLQSRYYDASVGRFINGDESFLIIIEQLNESNLFMYCKNIPVNKCDSLGFASYKNTSNKDAPNLYTITSIITSGNTKLNYQYKLDNGIIRFAFANNNYWSVLWRGWAKTLAKAMYKAVRSINSSYLMGRTISGIHTELFLHWALYKVGIKRSSTKQADMGSCRGTGYDSNAWIFESLNIILMVSKIGINALLGYISLFRSLSKYF